MATDYLTPEVLLAKAHRERPAMDAARPGITFAVRAIRRYEEDNHAHFRALHGPTLLALQEAYLQHDDEQVVAAVAELLRLHRTDPA